MTDFSDYASAYLARTLLAGGTLLALAWLAMRLLRQPVRRVALAGWAVRGAVLIAVLGLFPAWLTITLPAPETPAPVVEPKPAAAVVEATVSEPVDVEWVWVPADEAATPLAVEAPAAVAPAPEPIPVRTPWQCVRPYLFAVYGVIAAFALLQLSLAMIALIRLRRTAQPVPDFVNDLLPPDAPLVKMSARVRTPVCFGLRTPTVLLPESLLLSASPDELRWVLAHECDHLCRGDARTGVWVGVARAVYFALPWFWTLRRDLRLAQEYLADAAAAAGRTADYAAFLVHLSDPSRVRRETRTLLTASPMLAGRTELFRRIAMLTQSNQPPAPRASRTWSLLTAGLTLGAAVTLSGLGIAEDRKPAESKETRTVVVTVKDDADAPKKDGDTKKDGEKKDVVIKMVDLGDHTAAVQSLSKAVSAALEKGDVAAAKDAMAKLNKALQTKAQVLLLDNHLAAANPKVLIDSANAKAALAKEAAKLADAERRLADAKEKLANPADSKALARYREQVDAAHAALAAKQKELEATRARANALAPAAPAVPAVPGMPPAAPAAARSFRVKVAAGDEAVKRMEEKVASLKKALAEVKEPEAKEALERTIEEFKKKIDEARRNGELKEAVVPPAGGPPHGFFEFRAVPFAGDAPASVKDAVATQIQNLKAQLAKLEKDNVAPERRAAAEAQIETLEAMLKALPDVQPLPGQFAPKVIQLDGNNLKLAQGGLFTAKPDAPRGRLGIDIETIPDDLLEHLDLPKNTGVRISRIHEKSVAEKIGLKANDILLGIDGKDVPAETEALVKLVAGIKPETKFDIVVLRKGKKEFIKGVEFPKAVEVKKKKAEASDSIQGKEPGVQFSSMSVSVQNDEFTISAKNADLSIKITGTFDDGKPVPSSISGERDGVKFSAKDLKSLGEADRAVVEQLLKNVRGGKE